MYFTKTTLSAAFVAAVNGHMIMTQPSPFDPAGLNNSPLDASGSDFPCKFNGAYTGTGGTTNVYELGSSQPLSFVGSAVHGGGSCQISVTYDNPPTKDSKWKVIHSIEGGCPARNTAGNLTPNADGADPFKYEFKVPNDIPAGNGTIGWTWFNRIGNREMYMNCGPLQLTGTGGDKANYDKLPDMVVLNIGGHPTTLEGVDYKFENPGPSVEDNTGPYGVATCGSDGCKAGDSAGSPPPPPPPASSTPGGVFLTSSAPAAPTVVPSTTAAAPVVPSSTVAAPVTAPTAPAGSGSSTGLTGPCTTEGMWNCIGGTSFQQCASGTWSAVSNMASGTKCTPGQSAQLSMSATRRRARVFRG
ncbi:hypothetical protein GGS21DRAFT_16263 [Xylaria nigripes]|nr:hypothetical protein GGS21DRAFT_16263 [Xylaria nigripes]